MKIEWNYLKLTTFTRVYGVELDGENSIKEIKKPSMN